MWKNHICLLVVCVALLSIREINAILAGKLSLLRYRVTMEVKQDILTVCLTGYCFECKVILCTVCGSCADELHELLCIQEDGCENITVRNTIIAAGSLKYNVIILAIDPLLLLVSLAEEHIAYQILLSFLRDRSILGDIGCRHVLSAYQIQQCLCNTTSLLGRRIECAGDCANQRIRRIVLNSLKLLVCQELECECYQPLVVVGIITQICCYDVTKNCLEEIEYIIVEFTLFGYFNNLVATIGAIPETEELVCIQIEFVYLKNLIGIRVSVDCIRVEIASSDSGLEKLLQFLCLRAQCCVVRHNYSSLDFNYCIKRRRLSLNHQNSI